MPAFMMLVILLILFFGAVGVTFHPSFEGMMILFAVIGGLSVIGALVTRKR